MPNEDLTEETATLNLIYTPATVVPCPTTAKVPKTQSLPLSTKILRGLALSFSETYQSTPATVHRTSNIPGVAGFPLYLFRRANFPKTSKCIRRT